MKKLMLLVALALGCTREPETATSTIAPAEPRPAPTPPAAVADRPRISTSGSPPPASVTAPGTARVRLERGRIDMRELLPRGHTAFHIDNATGQAHVIAIGGESGSASVEVPPNGSAVIQLLVGAGRYEVSCRVPGHAERAVFETYVAGTPLTVPAEAGSR